MQKICATKEKKDRDREEKEKEKEQKLGLNKFFEARV